MEDITNSMMDIVRSHREWAFVVVGISAFAEFLFAQGFVAGVLVATLLWYLLP